jgi:hypothetical protein
MEQITFILTECTDLNFMNISIDDLARMAATGDKQALREIERRGLI